MRLLQLATMGALVSTWLAFGCGGVAVIDPGGGQAGAGGTSVGTPTGTGTGTGTPTGTGGVGGTSPGGPLQQACVRFCEAVEGCASYPGCVSECMADVSPECLSQYLTLLECAASNMGPPLCEFPELCTDLLLVWSNCEEGAEPPPPPNPCGPMGCAIGSDGSCTCQVTCPDGFYEAECTPAGPTNSCTCRFNGQTVGTCTDASQYACEPFAGCCAVHFF
ncbi:MAG: hypothetical protein JRI23_27495 [Deltaproteobacteria bacterium]|jgi:hypothetical protein|nr:hypothetical protein [Deltaproteobacteria bacterium]MBW2535825.1 hypothetical protein [Deltaproteobacteria bacterium]